MISKFFWIFLEKGGVTLFQFLTLLLLGRLLAPDTFGVYGTMIIYISIAETLIDSGFGGAIVQKKEINQQDINTLFYFNITISFVSYIILFLVSPYIESFYKIEKLSLYFRVLGCTMIFYSFSLIQISLMNRKLQFKKSSALNLASYLCASLIAIVLAFCGCGIWSLIFQLVFSSLFLAIFCWTINRVKITCTCSKKSFRYLWSFGINTVGANILQTTVNNIISSIIPKVDSVKNAGLYLNANRVCNIPINILMQCIDKGIFPILSREENLSLLVRRARSLNKYFISFVLPFFPLISLSSVSILKLLLGEKWVEGASFLSALAWSGIGLSVQTVYRNIVKSTGKTKYIFIIEILKSLFVLLLVVASIPYGLTVMIYAFVLASFIGVFMCAVLLQAKFCYSIIAQLNDSVKPIAASLVIYFLILYLKEYNILESSIFIIPIGYILYIVVSFIFNNKEVKFVCYKTYSVLIKKIKK